MAKEKTPSGFYLFYVLTAYNILAAMASATFELFLLFLPWVALITVYGILRKKKWTPLFYILGTFGFLLIIGIVEYRFMVYPSTPEAYITLVMSWMFSLFWWAAFSIYFYRNKSFFVK